jgi:hypothetical protein
MKTNYEARENRIHNLRMYSQNKITSRWERQERRAAPMIGQLMRDGKTIHYVWPVGGKYFESPSFIACVEWLAKRGYVGK